MIMVQLKTGNMLSKIFAFSTCVTLHSFHGFGASENFSVDVWIAALSRNLNKQVFMSKIHIWIQFSSNKLYFGQYLFIESEILPQSISVG